MICPRCDGQGTVGEAKLKGVDDTVFVCDECDAMWRAVEEVGHLPWDDFATAMSLHGISEPWSLIESKVEAKPI